MSTTLEFLKNEAGEAEGLNDPGIETFRDSPFSSVAREAGQNTRDVRVDPSKPVRMAFRRLEIPTEELPCVDKYRDTIEICLALAQQSEDPKELSFFRQAKAVLERSSIPVLEIADFNTTGLVGPCEEGTPFHALLKATGVSAKDMETSGGSFGIGKNAVYAASDLQTAFYSTVYKDGKEGEHFLCQGKTRFRSFGTGDGRAFRSIGYWGNPEGFMPINDPQAVPEWLRRDEVGTSIFSIAMRESDDWESELIASIVRNFFVAIHRGEMEFEVSSEQINANNLLYKFEDSRIMKAAERAGYEEDFQFAKDLYECLRAEEDVFNLEVGAKGAGKFRVRLQIGEGLPRRIAIVRNGMYISDNLGSFGDKFLRFPMFREFVALVEPAGEQESIWLKSLENPRHDQLSAERLTNPDARETARAAGKRLAAEIRKAIRSKAKTQVSAETDLDELSEFFALEEKAREDEKGERDPYSFKVKKQLKPKTNRRTKPPVSEQPGEEGGSRRGEEEGDGDGSGPGPGDGSGTGGAGKRAAYLPMPLANPRTHLPDADDATRRLIRFTPEKSGQAVLKFETLGLGNSEDLHTVGGLINIDCTAGERQEIEVQFEIPYAGPIEIISWSEEKSDETQ